MSLPTLTVDTPLPPPEWALLERRLIQAQAEAIEAFHAKYFDVRGFLQAVPRWGGNDGPDDAAENFLNWTMLHALGGPDFILDLYRHAWEGHLRQYTEAKTVEVDLARDGMYYKEFPTMFDWYHHGEWLSPFVLEGLCDPGDATLVDRMRRFAGLYMGEDPQAPNYDSKQRIIRSMFNGSRGPLLRKATALDWTGDPIEIGGRFRPGHGEATFDQMIAHFKDYTDVVGDHPLNLGATTLACTAYALTGEARYRAWLLEYVDAWVERTEANHGLIPSNIGLDGVIGGEAAGKWYGGCYGWAFSVINPANGQMAHRPACYSRAHYAFANAMLMTGERRYVDLWGRMIDKVNANAKTVDGKPQYPHGYGDHGWYEYKPQPFSPGAFEVYYWTMDPKDRARVPASPWLDYLAGRNPAFPETSLRNDFARLREKMKGMREDRTTPDCRMSDDMNRYNPAIVDSLNRLTLGGLPTGRDGFPLHCRLRYFDPLRRRAGLPEDVAALVTSLTGDDVRVTLVNLNPTRARTLIVQGGAYAEHDLERASAGGSRVDGAGSHLAVELAPGCGADIHIRTKRYANLASLAFPWD